MKFERVSRKLWSINRSRLKIFKIEIGFNCITCSQSVFKTPILFLSFLKRVLITQALSGKNVLIKGHLIPVRKAFIFFIDL